MASQALFMLRVIVRVEGPALGICIGDGPDRGGIEPWNIVCRSPATRSRAWRCSPGSSPTYANG
jgi:hypothetical protein